MITSGALHGNGTAYMAFYDAAFSFTSVAAADIAAAATFNCPAGSYFFRTSTINTPSSEEMIVYGSSLPSAYVPYSNVPFGAGVLGIDMSSYNLGPAIFNNGVQAASFNVDGIGSPQLIPGGVSNPSWAQEAILFKAGGNCLHGNLTLGSGDGALNKNAGGCNGGMSSLMLQINGNTIEDFEPDWHAKLHDGAGWVYNSPMTFTGGASSTNCGTGARFDPGSNDGAGRFVLGASPPATCNVQWMRAYVNAPPGWATSAPHCSVTNEGSRATGAITLTANPNSGDTVTIDGAVVAFGAQVTIGASAADTAANLYNYLMQNSSATPGNAPGADPGIVHFLYTNPSGGVVGLAYNYLGGTAGNSATLATSASGITLTTPSGAALPGSRYVIAIPGTGGMTVYAPGGTLNAGDVISYTCTAYW
jgi:hypothetical protein